MTIGKVVLYVFLFAAATMIIYSWGLIKQRNLNNNLINLLYAKGRKKILGALKKKGSMSRKELEKEIVGIKAASFFSRKRLVVTDPKLLTKNLLDNMVKNQELDVNRYMKPPRYSLKM